MKRIALLGATGSIGRQAIEVINAHPELELVAAASGSQPIDGLAPFTQTGGDLTELLERAQPDLVLNAVVGFAGLAPTMWALEHGVALALANKESLVAAGALALAAQERGGGALIPVDSEHSALFQCAQLGEPESLVLTASGGPFRGRTRDELMNVTPAEALAHPTWSMGPKITVDSATLANKGLEVIEAHFLFAVDYGRIEVVVHPTSIVHGLVRFRDGASIAHLGNPDMRVPISYALTYPDRAATPVPPLELRTLEFHEPDTETFRMLALGREAGERGGTYPCAYNAANEVAVDAFLRRRIGFLEIAELVEDVLERVDGSPAHDLDELVEADAHARALVAFEGLRKAISARTKDVNGAPHASGGGIEAAIKRLRENTDSAASRAEGDVADGVVLTQADERHGTIVAVGCETEAVSRNEAFVAFAEDVLREVHERGEDAVSLLDARRTELAARLGERIEVAGARRLAAGPGDQLTAYVHPPARKVGVLVDTRGGSPELPRELAMHIAFARPAYRTSDQVPPEVVQAERELLEQLPDVESKPPAEREEILDGLVSRRLYAEAVLEDQPWIHDTSLTVRSALDRGGLELLDYAWLAVG